MRHLTIALLAFSLLAAAVFRPTPSELARTLPAAGGSSADATLLVWATSQVSKALLARPLALFDAGIFHPLPNSLALSDHMIGQAVLGLPLWLATENPLLEYNLLSLASYVAGGTAMFLYARTLLGGGLVPALVAGVVFAFTPYRFASVLWLQVLWTAFIPLALAAWLRFVATGRLRPWFAWVACWVAQGLMGQYIAVYFSLVMGAVGGFALLAAPTRRHRRLWVGTMLAPLAVATILLPTVLPYLELRATQGTTRSGGLDTSPVFLWPGPTTLLGALIAPAPAVSLGPGIVAWGLAALGLVVGRQEMTPLRPLSSTFVWATQVVGLAASLALVFCPLRWQQLLPALDMTRNTNRAFFVGLCFLAALAAAAVQWLVARVPHRRALGVGLLMLALVDMGRPPRERQPFPTAETLSPGVRHLARLPPGSVVYEVADFPEQLTRSMYHALFHGHRIPVGYAGVVPAGGEYVTRRLATFPAPAAMDLLRDLGVGWVLARAPSPAGAPRLVEAATALGARLDAQYGTELIFDVRQIPPRPPHPSTMPLSSARVRLASNQEDGDLGHLLDNDPATVWVGMPRPDEPTWIRVDLSQAEPLAGIELVVARERALAAHGSQLALSDDGIHWRPLEVAFVPRDLQAFLLAPARHVPFVASFAPTSARYVRLANPALASVQTQVAAFRDRAEALGLPLALGWQGEWILAELRVLQASASPAVAP